MTAASQVSRVSVAQMIKLIDFLENHEDLALGHCRSKEGRQTNKRLWNDIATTLNSIGDGAIKDVMAWSKYWTNLKNRLKTKIRNEHAARRQTGGGAYNVVFTPLEQRIMAIIGSDAGAPLSGVQVNPFGTQESEVLQDVQEEQEAIGLVLDTENIGINEEGGGQNWLVEDGQHSQPTPGPSTTPVIAALPVEPILPGAPTRQIRRQRTRSRVHPVVEARADFLRLEEARIAAETRTAEYLPQIPLALLAIAAAISELAAAFQQ